MKFHLTRIRTMPLLPVRSMIAQARTHGVESSLFRLSTGISAAPHYAVRAGTPRQTASTVLGTHVTTPQVQQEHFVAHIHPPHAHPLPSQHDLQLLANRALDHGAGVEHTVLGFVRGGVVATHLLATPDLQAAAVSWDVMFSPNMPSALQRVWQQRTLPRSPQPLPHMLAAADPRFADARVQALYAQHLPTSDIDYAHVRGLVSAIFSHDAQRIDEDIQLLQAHEHLHPEFLFEICAACQRALDGVPPRVDNNADVILRYDALQSKGATEATRQAMLDHPDIGIAPLAPYVRTGSMQIPEVMTRKLNPEALRTLRQHVFLHMARTVLAQPVRSHVAILGELLRDSEVGAPVKRTVFTQLGVTYDSQHEQFMKGGAPYTTDGLSDADCAERARTVLFAMIHAMPHPSLSDPQRRARFFHHVQNAAFHVLQGNAHFVENVADVRALLPSIGRGDEATMQSLYQSVRQIVQHGLPDYSVEGLVDTVKTMLLTHFPEPATIVQELQQRGFDIDAERLNPSWIAAARERNQAAMDSLRAKRQYRDSGVLHQHEVYLREIDLGVRRRISALRSWPQIVVTLPRILERTRNVRAARYVAQTLSALHEAHARWSIQLNSFGKYFAEIPTGRVHDLVMVPVRGLAAGAAIDSGSDCGKGDALLRTTSVAEYTTFVLTNPERTALFGYVGTHEVDSDEGLLLQTDAVNPSTNLEVSGLHILQGVRDQFADMQTDSASSPEPIVDILLSGTSDLVSNRDAVAARAENFQGVQTTSVYNGVKARARELLKIEQGKPTEATVYTEQDFEAAEASYRDVLREIQALYSEFTGGLITLIEQELGTALERYFVEREQHFNGRWVDEHDVLRGADDDFLWESFRERELDGEDEALLMRARLDAEEAEFEGVDMNAVRDNIAPRIREMQGAVVARLPLSIALNLFGEVEKASVHETAHRWHAEKPFIQLVSTERVRNEVEWAEGLMRIVDRLLGDQDDDELPLAMRTGVETHVVRYLQQFPSAALDTLLARADAAAERATTISDVLYADEDDGEVQTIWQADPQLSYIYLRDGTQ